MRTRMTAVYFVGVTPSRKLTDMIDDKDVIVIAREHISDWEALATHLSFTNPQKTGIKKSHPEVEEQARSLLQKWKTAKGNGATYQALITAAEAAGDKALADHIRSMCR